MRMCYSLAVAPWTDGGGNEKGLLVLVNEYF